MNPTDLLNRNVVETPPPTVDADGAPLYRDGMGPGDPVRCAND